MFVGKKFIFIYAIFFIAMEILRKDADLLLMNSHMLFSFQFSSFLAKGLKKGKNCIEEYCSNDLEGKQYLS